MCMTDKAGTASNICRVGRGGNILHISFLDNTGTPQDEEEVLDLEECLTIVMMNMD